MANDILSKFIRAIKDEFKDENWDYLTYIADRVRVEGYVNELIQVHNAAVDYIKSVLLFRGSGYELIDPVTYEDGMEDEVYGLPRGNVVNKNFHYFEFPLVVINISADGELSFEGLDLGDYMDDKIFSVEELSTDVIVALADRVRELEGADGSAALDNFLESADMPQD